MRVNVQSCACGFADNGTSSSPIAVAVLGDDPFGRVLEERVRGETSRGRRQAVELPGRAEEVKTCHILFISLSEIRPMDEIVKSLKGKPILTVTDAQGPEFADVVIRLVFENHKLHFQTNRHAAQAVNLTFSSRLLRAADTAPSAKKP